MNKEYTVASFILASIAFLLLHRASIIGKVIQQKDNNCRDIATANSIPLSDYSNFMQSCID